jgi:hypothetical protein
VLQRTVHFPQPISNKWMVRSGPWIGGLWSLIRDSHSIKFDSQNRKIWNQCFQKSSGCSFSPWWMFSYKWADINWKRCVEKDVVFARRCISFGNNVKILISCYLVHDLRTWLNLLPSKAKIRISIVATYSNAFCKTGTVLTWSGLWKTSTVRSTWPGTQVHQLPYETLLWRPTMSPKGI